MGSKHGISVGSALKNFGSQKNTAQEKNMMPAVQPLLYKHIKEMQKRIMGQLKNAEK